MDKKMYFPFQAEQLIDSLGGKEQTIKFLDESIVNNVINFPFHAHFIDPVDVMFDRLKTYQEIGMLERYRLKSFYPKIKGLYFPPLFRGKSVYFYSSDSNYQQIDLISDHFIEDIRLQTHREGHPSVMDYWTNNLSKKTGINYRHRFLKKLVEQPQIDFPTMRNVLYTMEYESKQFRPTWAIGLIKLITGGTGGKILDISAGWGDRLLAAMSINYSYLGVDPNIDLKSRHDSMIRLFGDPKKHQIIYQPFEAIPENDLAKFSPQGFDLVLSSPPFFNVELYPGPAKTQSSTLFPTVAFWLNGFLFPSIQKSWNLLKTGGYLAIHIGDVPPILIAEPMNLYIEELPDASYEGIIGVSGKKGEARPVFVWKKIGRSDIKIRWNHEVDRNLRNIYPELFN